MHNFDPSGIAIDKERFPANCCVCSKSLGGHFVNEARPDQLIYEKPLVKACNGIVAQ